MKGDIGEVSLPLPPGFPYVRIKFYLWGCEKTVLRKEVIWF